MPLKNNVFYIYLWKKMHAYLKDFFLFLCLNSDTFDFNGIDFSGIIILPQICTLFYIC